MTSRLRFCASLGAFALSIAPAGAQTFIYSDASTEDRLKSVVGVGIGEDALSVNAEMTVVGEDGRTKVMPRLSSSWSGAGVVDVRTSLTYGDWNRASDPLRPALDTRVLVTPGMPLIERLEARLRRADSAARESLNVSFAGVDTDFRLLGGRALGIDADMTLRESAGAARALSTFTSTFGIGSALDVKSVLKLENVRGAPLSDTLETRLVYDSPAGFVERLEGRVYRAQGTSRQSLAVLFPEVASGDGLGTSFRITSKAMLEELMRADGLETLRMGVETKVSGVMPPLLGGRNALSVKLQRGLGPTGARSSSLVYDHEWSPGDASVGFKLELPSDASAVEPSLGIDWSARF